MPLKIVLIGSGNVASALARELEITQCYARKENSAKEMAQLARCAYTTSLETVVKDADLYLISISDDAIEPFCEELTRRISSHAIVAHTSGTMPIDALCAPRRAVFYPLQRFVKGKEVHFSEIPLLVEGSTKEVEETMVVLAKQHSERVETVSSDKRRELHIAAVLACNFTNHLYALAWRYLQEKGLSFDLMKPLIKECVEQVLQHKGDIAELQTGPAAREDHKTMDAHLAMLRDDENLKNIYTILSKSIINGKF